MFERYSERARQIIFLALWSARRRGGSYIEPEDLLHAIIREDRGEFLAAMANVFPGGLPPGAQPSPRGFFTADTATNLLRELDEDPEPLTTEPPSEKREPVPKTDLPVSLSLKHVLAVATITAGGKNLKTIEPLHLLAAIAEDRDSRLAQLLRGNGVTRQKIREALLSPDAG